MAVAAIPSDDGLEMRGRRDGAGVALVLALAVACAAACSSNGKANGRNSANDAGTNGATWGASACSRCIDSSCSQQIQSCSQDPSCAAYLTCLRKCPVAADGNVDATCAAKCPTASGTSGKTAIAALDQCRQSGAGASCAACGGTSDDGGSDAGDGGCETPLLCQQCGPSQEPDAGACAACEDQYCCDSRSACHNDPTCVAYLTCMQSECTASSTADCIDFCDKAHPGGFQKFANVFACVQAKCANGECAAPTKCQTCLNKNCANEQVACDTNETCFQATYCIGNCNGVTQCINDCKTKYPNSEPMLDAFLSCAVSLCQGCL